MPRVACTATGAGLVHGVGAGLAHGLAFARDVVRDLRRRRTGEAIFGAVPCVTVYRMMCVHLCIQDCIADVVWRLPFFEFRLGVFGEKKKTPK